MKRYWVLFVIVTVIAAVAAIVRFMPPDTVVIEKEPTEKVTVYDTVKIISTQDGRSFKARRVDINRADPEELKKVYGIGEVLSKRIVEYRDKLGGFHSKEQLREVRGITEEVYHNTEANFWVDAIVIQKINLNFATLKQLTAHPYFSASMSKRIVRAVEMKGGYETLRQLLEENILLPEEARQIAPYVVFSAVK